MMLARKSSDGRVYSEILIETLVKAASPAISAHCVKSKRKTGRDGCCHDGAALQDAEKVYQVLFFFVREPNLETTIEEVHQFGQIADGTVGEVGGAGAESAELLSQD
jgi:hypothetical protein